MDFKTLITRSFGEGGSTDSEWYRKRDEDPKLQKKKITLDVQLQIHILWVDCKKLMESLVIPLAQLFGGLSCLKKIKSKKENYFQNKDGVLENELKQFNVIPLLILWEKI